MSAPPARALASGTARKDASVGSPSENAQEGPSRDPPSEVNWKSAAERHEKAFQDLEALWNRRDYLCRRAIVWSFLLGASAAASLALIAWIAYV
jgi:hypothetical protein